MSGTSRPPEDSRGGWSEPGSGGSNPPSPAEVDGRYEVGPLLGRGGMGVVYAARDTRLGRDVARKELQPELATDPVAAGRLAREAAITSRLDHPGIVAVHDVGLLQDGRPFYTMRLVRGRTLAAATAGATAEARRPLIRHVLAAADALAAAHDAGIVHRDVKPANILIGPHGETQLVDWGLATPTAAALSRWPDLPASTACGAVGTPGYMAPESSRGDPPDPRHDVWSLGATLADVVGEPLPPELAAIVARAKAADPSARYPDATAFSDDLLRWLDGRRVAAHTYSRGELWSRVVAAYRLPLVVGAVGSVALGVAVAVGWWETSLSLDQARVAEADAVVSLADLRLERAVEATRAGRREEAERLALAVLQTREDPLARGVFAAFGRAERPTLLEERNAYTRCDWSALLPGGEFICGTAGNVGRWHGKPSWQVPLEAVGGVVRGQTLLTWDAHDGGAAVDVRNGHILAQWTLGRSPWLPQVEPRVIWDDGVVEPPGAPEACPSRVRASAVSDTGRLATMCDDGTLILGTPEAPQQRTRATEASGDHVASAMVWAPNGTLVVGTLRGRIYVFSGDTGETMSWGSTELGAIDTLVAADDGRHVSVSGTAGGVGIWRTDTASLVAEVPAGRPRAMTVTTEGLVVHADGVVRTWRLPSGAPVTIRADAGLADVAVAPDGSAVAIAGGDGAVARVQLATGEIERFRLGDEVVKAVAFGPGGLWASGMAEPWLTLAGDPRPIPGARPLRRLAALPDGSLVGLDLHAGIYRWDTPTSTPEILAADAVFTDLELDGSSVVLLSEDHESALGGKTLVPAHHVPGARALARRGEWTAVARPPGVDLLHGLDPVRHLDADGTIVLDVALSADGGRVAGAGLDGLVRIWNTTTGARLGTLPGHSERAVAVEFLPDGDLVSASWDKTARLWDLDTLERPVPALAAEVAAAWGEAGAAAR